MPSKLTAYLQLARVSNLPTVFSNVLVGAAMASGFFLPDWTHVALATIAVSLFYIGGMALNDLIDREIDLVERPQRPIPSGALSIAEVRAFIVGCLIVGLALLACTQPISLMPAAAL